MNRYSGTDQDQAFQALQSDSRNRLLTALGTYQDLTLFRTIGNIGDRLIHAGARQLLRECPRREADIWQASRYSGDLALVCGSGGFCRWWHDLPMYVRELERNFRRVIVWPSSFDLDDPVVASWVRDTTSTIFCRETVSAGQVRALRNVEVALDTAFFFDFSPYRYKGAGVLHAYRLDRERVSGIIPADNVDISAALPDLDSWLHVIAGHDVIFTDRAHVMIAGCMLRKRVHYRASAYHKLTAIAEFALKWCDGLSADEF